MKTVVVCVCFLSSLGSGKWIREPVIMDGFLCTDKLWDELLTTTSPTWTNNNNIDRTSF